MRLTYQDTRYIFICSYDDRHRPKAAGFRWDPHLQRWVTPSSGIASRLLEFADEKAKNELERTSLTRTEWRGAIPHPEGLKPKPFQLDAVKFALERNRSYLALEAGLGKTICAALMRNALLTQTLYICPPFLAANVEEEFLKWGTSGIRVARFGKLSEQIWAAANVILLPDSLLAREHARDFIRAWVKTANPGLLIVDEAHRFKNDSAERTKALFQIYFPLFPKVVFLSGTPMPNRPRELFPVLSNAAPQLIDDMSKLEYGIKYCAGHQGKWGWDDSGATNVEELAKKVVGPFMRRVRKKDVLPELPPKTEELVFIDEELPAELLELSRKILKEQSPVDLMKGRIGDEHVATYRRKLGTLKVPPALEFLRFVLEENDDALLIFAIHKETIAALAAGLKNFHPLTITGDVASDERFRRAKAFQANPKHRALILNIQAGGIGFNLTKASRVVFVEFSWCGADNDQAIDRAHRIGQDEKVVAQYLVHRNSIDRDVMETVLRKKESTQYV
jgi:SWI/SNF-related matrix-associated actin-dependent regulator 1 of chromatin subfamily A